MFYRLQSASKAVDSQSFGSSEANALLGKMHTTLSVHEAETTPNLLFTPTCPATSLFHQIS